MRCPSCGNKLLQKSGSSTRLRITGVVEFSDDGEAHAQCFWCKTRVQLPITLKQPAEDEERFVIRVAKPPSA